MIQQIIALVLIIFMLVRLLWQRQKKQLSTGEFFLWFAFWICAGLAIIFIKKIDFLVGVLGFSSSGIDVLLYFSILLLLYMIFRLRLKIEKQDRIITRIVREISLINKK